MYFKAPPPGAGISWDQRRTRIAFALSLRQTNGSFLGFGAPESSVSAAATESSNKRKAAEPSPNAAQPSTGASLPHSYLSSG